MPHLVFQNALHSGIPNSRAPEKTTNGKHIISWTIFRVLGDYFSVFFFGTGKLLPHYFLSIIVTLAKTQSVATGLNIILDALSPFGGFDMPPPFLATEPPLRCCRWIRFVPQMDMPHHAHII